MVSGYLDYSKSIRLDFKIKNNNITYEICLDRETELEEIIKENLKDNITIEYVDGIFYLWIGNQKFLKITNSEVESLKILTSFETRLLSQVGDRKFPLKRKNASFQRQTDVHTHLSASPRAKTLIKLGLENHLMYPTYLLNDMNIKYKKEYVTDGCIDLNYLGKNSLLKLKYNLYLSTFSLDTFEAMEDIYTYREPFTKCPILFKSILNEIASDYHNAGISYVELSFAEYLKNKEILDIIVKYVPELETKYGVKLAFLASVRRSAPIEKMLDRIDEIISLGKNPYIVGCDFMGYEINSILDCRLALEKICKYAFDNDPNFVIRIHAGENISFTDNVKNALNIIYEVWKKSSLYKKKIKPNIRLGHGLYGFDEESSLLAKELGAIIEFNMTSNLSLNNINDITDVPIKKYINEGIYTVLGSDGYGLYSSFFDQEMILAQATGLTQDDFNHMTKSEDEVITRALDRRQSILKKGFEIKYPHIDKPRFTTTVEKGYQEKEYEDISRIYNRLDRIGIIIDEKKINRDIKGKTPILITGASKNSIKIIDEETIEYIRSLARDLVSRIDPKRAYFVTGGTNYGVEKIFHEEIYKWNLGHDDKIIALGTFTLDALPSEIESNTITHGLILKVGADYVKTWYVLPESQLNFIRKHNGIMIAIGGGKIVDDMIQIAYNRQLNMYIMDGPEGSSTRKSKYLGDLGISFKTTTALIKSLYKNNQNTILKHD